MPIQIAASEEGGISVTYDGYGQGVDTRSSPTKMSPTHVPDAANIFVAGGFPDRMNGSTLYQTGFITPDGKAPTFHTTYRSIDGSEVTHLIGCQNGQIYKWTGTAWVSLRSGLTQIDGATATQVVLATDCETAGLWSFGPSAAQSNAFQKSGTYSIQLYSVNAATIAAFFSPVTALDFTGANGIRFWVSLDGAANVDRAQSYIQFGNAAGTDYYRAPATMWGTLADYWNQITVPIADLTATGAPSWAAIGRIVLVMVSRTSTNVSAYFDDIEGVFGTAPWWSDKQISDVLVLGNMLDPNLKYDGTRLLPVGAKHIFDGESTEATWTGSTSETDTTYVKQGTQSQKITSAGGVIQFANFTPPVGLDLTAGILPFVSGGVDYSTTDYIDLWMYIDTQSALNTSTSYILFIAPDPASYYQFTATGWGNLTDGWNKLHLLKSTAGVTGTPDWATISTVMFGIQSVVGTVNVWVDDCYMIYANVMPPCQVVFSWKSMLLGIQSQDNPSGVHYSIVGGVDIWDPNAVYDIEEGDGTVCTGVFIGYADQIIITKSNTVHPVSVRLTGEPYPDYLFSSTRRLTAEHGCDSHRSIAEGSGKWFMWWKGGIYQYSGVSTERISYHVEPTTSLVNNARGFQVVGNTLRRHNGAYWFYPTGTSVTNDACIFYDYILQAFIPMTGQAMATAYTLRDDSGEESLLTTTYAGRILEQDRGTTLDGVALPGTITLPWTSGGGSHPMISWHELHIPYDTQTSGTLLVEYRIAEHPREFDAAVWVSAASIDMSVVAEYGKVPIAEIARWIQVRLRTVADPMTLYWPITLLGMPLGGI